MKTLIAFCFMSGLALAAAEPAAPAGPPVMITLGAREAHVTPARRGFTHTGGGNLDVAQPSPDTVILTMSAVAVAGGHPCKSSVATMTFDVEQCFDVAFDKPELRRAKLTLEGRVIGLLRSHAKGGGTAHEGPGQAVVNCGPAVITTLALTPHSVTCGENLSVNCRSGPVEGLASVGAYTLHQSWVVSATHPTNLLPCKAASAEFAPDPALDPLWISAWEPFHGAQKKDFGFQVILRVAPDNSPSTTGK